jgi:hypothetical protein
MSARKEFLIMPFTQEEITLIKSGIAKIRAEIKGGKIIPVGAPLHFTRKKSYYRIIRKPNPYGYGFLTCYIVVDSTRILTDEYTKFHDLEETSRNTNPYWACIIYNSRSLARKALKTKKDWLRKFTSWIKARIYLETEVPLFMERYFNALSVQECIEIAEEVKFGFRFLPERKHLYQLFSYRKSVTGHEEMYWAVLANRLQGDLD